MRYGGEEFAVLLPRIDEIGALAVAEAICRTVRQHSIRHAGGKNGIVTVSIGAACITPHPNMPVGQLLRAADQALYAAKSAGRDKAVGASTLPAPVATSTSSAKPKQDVARG